LGGGEGEKGERRKKEGYGMGGKKGSETPSLEKKGIQGGKWASHVLGGEGPTDLKKDIAGRFSRGKNDRAPFSGKRNGSRLPERKKLKEVRRQIKRDQKKIEGVDGN